MCRRCLEGERAGRAGGCHGAGPRGWEIAAMAAWGRRARAQTWPSPSPTSWQPGGTSTAGSSSRWMSTAPTPHRLSRSTTLTRDVSSPHMCKCKYYSVVIAPAQPSEWLLPCRCGIWWTSRKEFKERCRFCCLSNNIYYNDEKSAHLKSTLLKRWEKDFLTGVSVMHSTYILKREIKNKRWQ